MLYHVVTVNQPTLSTKTLGHDMQNSSQSRSQKAIEPLIISGLLFFTAFNLIFYLGGELNIPGLEVHSLGLGFEIVSHLYIIFSILVVIAWFAYRSRTDLFEYPVWFVVNFAAQVVFSVWLLQRNFEPRNPLLQDPPTYFTQAILLMFFSSFFLWVGYALVLSFLRNREELGFRGLAANKAKTDDQVTEEPRMGLIFIVWAVTQALLLMVTLSGALPLFLRGAAINILQNYIYFIELINLTTFLILLWHFFKNPSPQGYAWLAMAVLFRVTADLFIASRASVLFFVYILCVYYYVKRRIPIRWILGGLIVGLFFVPLVNDFRDSLVRSTLGINTLNRADVRAELLAGSFQEVTNSPIAELLVEFLELFQTRQSRELGVMATFIEVHPDPRPFVMGEMLESVALRLIPRFIWLDKPTERPELYLILSQYYGASGDFSFVRVNGFADSYRMGGLPFSAIYFLSLGAFMAVLYFRGPYRGHERNTIFYIYMIHLVLPYHVHFSEAVIGLIQFGITMWFVLRYVFYARAEPAPAYQQQLRVATAAPDAVPKPQTNA